MKNLKLKSKLLVSTLLIGISFSAYSQSSSNTSPVKATLPSATQQLTEKNKQIVTEFYQGVFEKHQVKTYADRYLVEKYIQHNPNVADGKAPFVNYFVQYFKDHPQAKNQIKKVIAEGDLVALHVHSTQNKQDRGNAIIDIFRVEDGKIVEHWDVIQPIPAKSANSNSMF